MSSIRSTVITRYMKRAATHWTFICVSAATSAFSPLGRLPALARRLELPLGEGSGAAR
jgi:hypothetical protein